MRKTIPYAICLVLLGLLIGIVYADATSWDIKRKPNEKWLSGSTGDPAWNWMKEVDKLVSIGPNPGTGQIFYVDSGVTTAGNGKNWDNAVATIDAAVNLCTANRGDIILVAQGHNESLTAADGVDVDVAGVTVRGLGNGSLKPTLDYDNANGEFVIGADNVTIINLRFRCSANAVTKAIDVEDGVCYASIIGCEFGYAETGTDEFTEHIIFNDASNYGLVEGCFFDPNAQNAQSAIMFNKDTHGTIIRGNTFIGKFATAVFEGATTASTSVIICDNKIFGVGTADTFNLVAGTTGMVTRNYMTMTAASAAAALDIGNCVNIENWLIADDDVGGSKGNIDIDAFASVTATADD